MRKIFAVFAAITIPLLLILTALQSRKYIDLQNEVKALEKKQTELVEANKKLITEISLLSGTDRIEDIAENQLGMRKAETEEIVRVEMKHGSKKK